MKGLFATAFLTVLVLPVAASAYDPVPDQALVRVLGERIDGDVNQGLLPNDRAALMRAEIEAAQKLVTNGDSQATAMLADIDRDLAPYDNTVDINEASRDLMYHVADTITIAMRDGAAWQVDNAQNTDIMDLKQKGTLYPPGVQGAYLAKSPGYTAITLSDPATGKHVRFRFYIVDKAAANEKAYRMGRTVGGRAPRRSSACTQRVEACGHAIVADVHARRLALNRCRLAPRLRWANLTLWKSRER